MARYSSFREKTDEEKRNIKVDLKRMPEWQNEINSIKIYFSKFNIKKISDAAILIHGWREKLHISKYYAIDDETSKLNDWIYNLSVEKLICFSFNGPNFLKDGRPLEIIKAIRSEIRKSNEFVENSFTVGVTNSSFMSIFFNKVHVSELETVKKNKLIFVTYEKEIPKIEQAISLIQSSIR